MMKKWRIADRLVNGLGAGLCGLIFGPIAVGLLFLFVAIGAPVSDPDFNPRTNIVQVFLEIMGYGYSYPFYIPIACAIIGLVLGVAADPDKADDVARRETELKEKLAKKAAQDEAFAERIRERQREAAIRKDAKL